MHCVNEWVSPDWVTLEWSAIPPEPGKAPKRPPATAAQRAPGLVDAIRDTLRSVRPRPPAAVHFYLGEGLRWIRVGFGTDTILEPAAVREIGSAIAACVAQEGVLYFHALRPRDVLFFLEGGNADKIGMSAASFGVPLDEVLQAWNLVSPPPAARKTKPRRRARAAA
jgi:hypothetical protein